MFRTETGRFSHACYCVPDERCKLDCSVSRVVVPLEVLRNEENTAICIRSTIGLVELGTGGNFRVIYGWSFSWFRGMRRSGLEILAHHGSQIGRWEVGGGLLIARRHWR